MPATVILKSETKGSIETIEPTKGTWQQIILIDFDERPREREILVKVI